jgi:hypothetical protein
MEVDLLPYLHALLSHTLENGQMLLKFQFLVLIMVNHQNLDFQHLF